MNDWDRVHELFLSTVELQPAEQQRMLHSLCPDRPEIRAEVESLLASDRDSGSAIAAAVAIEASALFDTQQASGLFENQTLAGKRLGAYRVVREIGRGGMGAVYLATRDDEEYHRQVAIKVVKPGMDSTEVLARFRYERQILANLDHPFIARLFDGGSTAEGLPFFVMEYVEGRPINAFCREGTLTNRARCELFLRVLEAVSYAHRNLVVHRDLKPSNIFVTPAGTPKLLDFGVAKLLSGNPDGSLTTTILRPFTPEYASPEQVMGLPVTTSTDIYSLGAVLYEMLTDRRAQPITTQTPSEVERAICHSEVPRPSLSAPSVDADLDNIVLMAMRKDSDRRYLSVDQFAEDIQRHLDGRPVLARRDSLNYRLRKFVVRNRVQIAMVALIVGALATGLAISIAQRHRAIVAFKDAESQRLIAVHESARAESEAGHAKASLLSEARQRTIAEQQSTLAGHQRDLAEEEKAVAQRRVTDLLDLADRTLFKVHDAVAKLPGSVGARKEIVKTTLDYLERLEKETGLQDEMRIALAAGYYKISLIQGNPFGPSLQDFSGAQASLLKAKTIILPLYQKKPDDPAVMLRWIEVQSGFAGLDHQAGKPHEAVDIYNGLLPVAHRLGQIKHCTLACETQESAIENALAIEYLNVPDPQGLEHATRGIALMRATILIHPGVASLEQELGSALASAAGAYKNAGELSTAADYYQQSIVIRERLLRDQPQDTLIRRNLMVAYGNYAAVLGIPWSANLGRPAEARAYCAKAVALARASVSSDQQDATARYDLAVGLGRLGMVDPGPNELKDSLASLRESIGLLEAFAKADPKSASTASLLAMSLEYQGHRLIAMGDTTGAIDSFRKSIALLEPFVNTGQASVIVGTLTTQEALAMAYTSTGETKTAVDLATRAVAIAEKYNAAPPPNEIHAATLARAYATLAAVQERAGDSAQAKLYAEKASTIWNGIKHPGILSNQLSLMADTRTLLTRLTNVTPPQ